MITSASKLAEMKTVRCGVIPYTVVESENKNTLHFLLARDRPTKELGDFGGGVRKDEFSLMAGLREFYEETRGIFSGVCKSANDVCTYLAVVDSNKMAVIFVPVESKWIHDAPKLFTERDCTKKRSNEVSELVWVSEDRFKALIQGNCYSFKSSATSTCTVRGKRDKGDVMWKKVRTFFSGIYRNEEFSETLRKIAQLSRI